MKTGIFDIEGIRNEFISIFKETPAIYRSPGRINIIGEHTDYNNGFVLPAAIDKAAYVAITPRADEKIHLYSVSFLEHFSTSLSILNRRHSWTDYVLGVVDQLKKNGYPIKGFNLVLDGDVIIGAGISSSAAVECCVIFALNDLFQLNIPLLKLVQLAQLAEHEFAGVKCGIMDQFASAFGKQGYAVQLDCRSLEYHYVPLKLDGYKLILLNSNVKHSLASTEYNTRRQQCEQGVAWVAEQEPGVLSLRDVTMTQLNKWVKERDPLVYQRCKYVLEENDRLQKVCQYLEQGNLQGLGQMLYASHEGLSRDYEVSCKELDWLVDFVKREDSVLGARMMGGGFGGCTINLVREDAVELLIENAKHLYTVHNELPLDAYIVEPEDGTKKVG